jgi:outer membrane protein OmpA-like peptidoglycan-associated protein
MSMIPKILRAMAVALLLPLLFTACTTTPPASPKSELEEDVDGMLQRMLKDWRERRTTPMFIARTLPSSLVIGEVADVPEGVPGEGYALPQTLASVRVRQFARQYLEANAPDVWIVRADAGAPSLLLSAQLEDSHKPDGSRYLRLMLLDAKTGEVLTRAQTYVRSTVADAFPSTFEAESPVLANQTAERSRRAWKMFGNPIGAKADSTALVSAAAAALVAQGQEAYLDGNYNGALSLFQRASIEPEANVIRVYNGQYLSYLRLGDHAGAMKAFERLVSEGLAARSLGVKLLFTPGETEFLADPGIRSIYQDWLHVIAAKSAAATTCLNVVGHTSHTGLETFNQELSLARSERVRDLLKADAPALNSRLSVTGKGWSENIVGSGTDDARDAIDRRVEFRVLNCAR